ncbi:MAG: nitroreductase family protein [Salinivirgaceae bacterium]|nr:nitroreductase family protein [Salinivirgaceae bacterium]
MADFNKIIYTRRSVRKFKDQKIELEKVEKLLKAALLAPSGKRIYPCEFIVVDDKEILNKLSQAKAHGAKLIEDAPLAIVIVADTATYDVWVEDASIASTYIMLEAENLNLGCCWVQMHLRGTEDGKTAAENMKATLKLESKHDILSVLAIGYKDEEKSVYTDDDLNYRKLHRNFLNNTLEFDY